MLPPSDVLVPATAVGAAVGVEAPAGAGVAVEVVVADGATVAWTVETAVGLGWAASTGVSVGCAATGVGAVTAGPGYLLASALTASYTGWVEKSGLTIAK